MKERLREIIESTNPDMFESIDDYHKYIRFLEKTKTGAPLWLPVFRNGKIISNYYKKLN